FNPIYPSIILYKDRFKKTIKVINRITNYYYYIFNSPTYNNYPYVFQITREAIFNFNKI
ncbi:hypothetical protein GE21DRAFT_1223826, partial [Neurospora crassa]